MLPPPHFFPKVFGPIVVLAVALFAISGCSLLSHDKATDLSPVSTEEVSAKPRRPIKTGLKTIAFTIQVGAFATERNAAGYAQRLQAQGLDAYHFIDTDGLHKVRFDRFTTKASAKNRAEALKTNRMIDVYYIVRALVYEDLPGESSRLRQDLLATAHRFIGTDYRWGGTSAESGLDCSGLTQTVYRLNGLDLPRSAREQYRAGEPVRQNELQNGDLIFFDTRHWGSVTHVGIYCGQNSFIHAPGSGKRIQTASLSDAYFSKRIVGARRYF